MIKFHLWKRRSKKKSSPCVITSGMSSFLARVVWMCVRLCSPALRTTLSCLCAPVPLYCLEVITHRHVHTCMFMCECVRFLSDNTISPSCCGESQDDQMTHIRHTHKNATYMHVFWSQVVHTTFVKTEEPEYCFYFLFYLQFRGFRYSLMFQHLGTRHYRPAGRKALTFSLYFYKKLRLTFQVWNKNEDTHKNFRYQIFWFDF